MNIQNLYSTARLWAADYIPGWPNSTPIPLLFGLWLGVRKKKPVIYILSIIIALILTSSRAALFGIVAIVSYSVLKSNKKSKYQWIFISIPIVVAGFLLWDDILMLIYQIVPSLEYRMSIIYDRQDIFNVSMQYFSIRPFLGFGGNTIDQIIPIYSNVSNYGLNWGHTHNWILEVLLRYGVIGLMLFSGFMVSILLRIKDKDKQFMFFLILVLGLFQTYMRNFSILLLMTFLTMEPNNMREMYLESTER